MWSCITGLWPQLPRNPEQTPFDLPDGQPWWTYGWKQLDGYEGLVDRDIRVMVARCLGMIRAKPDSRGQEVEC